MARFPSGKVVSALNGLVHEGAFTHFRTNVFEQKAPGWIPQVKVYMPDGIDKAALDKAIRQVFDIAGTTEGDMIITVQREDNS